MFDVVVGKSKHIAEMNLGLCVSFCVCHCVCACVFRFSAQRRLRQPLICQFLGMVPVQRRPVYAYAYSHGIFLFVLLFILFVIQVRAFENRRVDTDDEKADLAVLPAAKVSSSVTLCCCLP